ncbi:MAG: 50S ribosomal protein L25 [Bacteroidales bacterium]|nr:50S ribosomal protein L25 [Bacteroidales bacterium]
MKTVSMSGSLRENVGKKDAKKIRREGNVPCVLYGSDEQVHFYMSQKDFTKIIFTPHVYLLKINIGGNEKNAILQDIQYHPVTDLILHADFLEILPGKPVTIGIPLQFTGNPPGVLKGGKIRIKRRKLLVKGLAEDLPDFIEINIGNLDIGNILKVSDVTYANLEFLEPAGGEVVGVKTARGAGMGEEEVEDEEEGTEGEGATEGGEEGAPAAEGDTPPAE